jgi:hypothetical protein
VIDLRATLLQHLWIAEVLLVAANKAVARHGYFLRCQSVVVPMPRTMRFSMAMSSSSSLSVEGQVTSQKLAPEGARGVQDSETAGGGINDEIVGHGDRGDQA